jgi:methylenetetrahydrofolate reductase (NADPH)
MRLTHLLASRKKPTLSFELFPARDEKAAAKLPKVLDALAACQPDFVSVTFGAGGSTREGSYQLIKHLIVDRGLPVVAYFACYGLAPDEILSALQAYRDLGVETVLAVRGDPPHDRPDFQPHPSAPVHASDLIELASPRFDFCLGCAGYPEGHLEAESKQRDLEHLKQKIEAGAQFVITNYTYDNRHYFGFVERCRAIGVQVPILPGVMPIYSVRMMENLAKLCGASIPGTLRAGLAALAEGDRDALQSFSVDLAVSLCRELIEGGAPGVHLYSMDRSMVCVAVVDRLRALGLL